MRRETRFRAWNKVTKKMNAYVEIYCYKDGSTGCSAGENNNNPIGNTENFELMQFTGLKDKNGKEIYEGDIVKYWDIASDNYILHQMGKGNQMTIGSIIWYGSKCQLIPQEIKTNNKGGNYISYWDAIIEIEVIGNIYENPELLK